MNPIRNLLREESGSATVETALMLPLLLAFLSLTVDLALVFNSRAEVMRVMQEANRSVAVGRLNTTAAAEDYVETNIDHLTANAEASSTVTAGVITTTVRMPASDLMMTGLFTSILNVELTVSAQQITENWEA